MINSVCSAAGQAWAARLSRDVAAGPAGLFPGFRPVFPGGANDQKSAAPLPALPSAQSGVPGVRLHQQRSFWRLGRLSFPCAGGSLKKTETKGQPQAL